MAIHCTPGYEQRCQLSAGQDCVCQCEGRNHGQLYRALLMNEQADKASAQLTASVGHSADRQGEGPPKYPG